MIPFSSVPDFHLINRSRYLCCINGGVLVYCQVIPFSFQHFHLINRSRYLCCLNGGVSEMWQSRTVDFFTIEYTCTNLTFSCLGSLYKMRFVGQSRESFLHLHPEIYVPGREITKIRPRQKLIIFHPAPFGLSHTGKIHILLSCC